MQPEGSFVCTTSQNVRGCVGDHCELLTFDCTSKELCPMLENGKWHHRKYETKENDVIAVRLAHFVAIFNSASGFVRVNLDYQASKQQPDGTFSDIY